MRKLIFEDQSDGTVKALLSDVPLFSIYPSTNDFKGCPCFKVESLLYSYPTFYEDLDSELSKYLSKCFNDIHDAKEAAQLAYDNYFTMLVE